MKRGGGALLAVLAMMLCAASAAQAAFPGANGKIAFDTPGFGIHTVNPDGTGETEAFAGTRVYDFTGEWAGDGSKLLFSRLTYPPGGDEPTIEILQVSAAGGTPTPAAADSGWSADGSKIVSGGSPMHVRNADGTGSVSLGMSGEAPRWSPDGTTIVFHRLGGGISVINADGSGLMELTDGSEFDLWPDWSPDGTRIVFDANANIDVMNADGTGRVRLAGDSSNANGYPRFSPDGTKIVWLNWREPSPADDPTLWVMNADGSNQINLGAVTTDFTAGPEWQPVPIANHPPDCTGVAATPNVLWPPNHRFRSVALSGASDPDDDPLTLEITGVTQNEPVRGRSDRTAPDVRFYRHRDYVLLRAERNPHGRGRVYTIAFEVSDGSDSCTGTALVQVPRHRR